MDVENTKNYITALEKSVNEDIEELKKLQESNTKFQNMQGIKESIFRKRRQIAKLYKDLKNVK
tara:strand:+ start:81 stop:269 length:189 start_codon:yes stop_codon:yes gene_type:complete